ncbi:VWA domain-containing protein [Desulfovibrio sp. Huiquan2017]|uniref:VWA domain-containing protein n=1 Tax=Desulfovibrio sp. Huiquan2017 TaxID=2816861 RepID=UPI001A9256ED|nr:VWA domain-containing protein [Desulfovibrio sp. Huiquan2017]
MTNNLIMKSLPMVASVLGSKYGVKVAIGGKDAYTDGNTIHLPALPLECSETLIGLARGYIDHEAAHIRETRFDWLRLANLTPLEMHVWNTFEDWRVEHRLARLFPGCRSNFTWLIRHLFGDTSEKVADPAMAILNWLLLSVRAWDVPSLNGQRDDVGNFVESHYPGLTGRLNHVLEKVHAYCDSTQDCILYAREVVSLLKEKVASLPRQNGESKTGKSGKNGVSDELPLDALNRLIQADDIDLPEGLGEALAASLRKESPKELDESLRVARLGTKTTKPLDPEDVTATRRASIALRTQLQGLLQSSVLTRSMVGRHGRLDARQLHKVSVADARVFKRTGRKVGINTAVHILLDCSGSMRKRIKLTTQVCHAVAKALDAIDGINVAVTAFPAGAPSNGGNGNDRAPTVCPILAHGERMHDKFVVSATGCTPLGEAIWWTLQQMQPLTESRKIALILTDGDPDSFPAARNAIEDGRRFGVEIYGLGITSETITKLLPNHSRTINDLSELAPVIFGMLRGALVK